MALMLAQTYDALVAAGAPDDKARAAAEEIAGFENRLAKIENDLELIKATMATKSWTLATVLGQTFILLGGFAALIKLLH